MNNKIFLVISCFAGLVLPVKVEVVGLDGRMDSFALKQNTLAELQKQILEKSGLIPAFYRLVLEDTVLTENHDFLEQEDPITISIIKGQNKITPILTFFCNSLRGQDSLTPAGYAQVICKLNIKLNTSSYNIEIDTGFFNVNENAFFMNWQDPGQKKLALDQDLGNFVALLQQGYNVHDAVMEFVSENYKKIHNHITQCKPCERYLDNDFGELAHNKGNNLLFARLDRIDSLRRDMSTVFTSREYLNYLYTSEQNAHLSFDEIIGWGLCTLLKHGLKAEIPIRHILDAIVSVIYDLNNQGPISEMEIHKQFYGYVSSVVQEYVKQQLNEAQASPKLG